MEAVRFWLNNRSELFLPKNADDLRVNVENSVGRVVPSATVDRCRRKVWENGDAIIEDPVLREEYIKTRTNSEEEYRKFFGRRNKE